MESELLIKYSHIFENISDYALITVENGYLLYNVKQQGIVMLEHDGDKLIELLIKKNMKIVSSQTEVHDPEFIHYVSIWDDAKGDWIQIPESDIEKYSEK